MRTQLRAHADSPAALGISLHPRAATALLFPRIWSLGQAGAEIPLRIERDGRSFDQKVTSSERNRFFKVPRMH
jgi:hypothetical protein